MAENDKIHETTPATQPLDENAIRQWLHPVMDPEMGLSLEGLGLIYDVQMLENNKLQIKMTLTSPACPAGDFIVKEVRDRALEHEKVQDAEVEIVWDPPWDPRTMASEETKEVLGLW